MTTTQIRALLLPFLNDITEGKDNTIVGKYYPSSNAQELSQVIQENGLLVRHVQCRPAQFDDNFTIITPASIDFVVGVK
jgi:hypothetical protein